MTVEIRTIRESEFPDYVKTMFWAVGRPVDPAFVAERRRCTDLAHALAAFEDGRLVGTLGMRHLTLRLPGGNVTRLAALGQGGVLPGYTAHGHSRRMVMHLMGLAKEQGIALAGGTMAEWPGFGRFGWGPATYACSYEIEARRARFRSEMIPEAGGRCRLVSSDEAKTLLPVLHASSASAGTNLVARDAEYWSVMVDRLDRGESLDVLEVGSRYPAPFYALYSNGEGAPEGIAVYRIESKWRRGLSRTELEILFLIHSSDAAHTALWRHLLSLAHVEKVLLPHGPADHPLSWMLVDGRRLENAGTSDHIWLRILDVPAALAQRDCGMLSRALTVRFVDEQFGERKTYRLAPDNGRLDVEETNAEPEVETDVSVLATLFLGGTRIAPLRAAKKLAYRSQADLLAFASIFAGTSTPFVDTEF